MLRDSRRRHWRLRPGELFKSLRDLSYPPAGCAPKRRMNARGDSVLTIAKIKCVIPKSLFVLLGVTDRAFSKKQEDPSHALVAEFCRHEITKAIAERDEYNSTIALAKFF